MQHIRIENGLYGELDVLQTPEVIDHLRNYIGNFLLDGVVASAYLNRLGRELSPQTPRGLHAWVVYLLDKIVQDQPFNEQARQIRVQLTGRPDPLLKPLERCRLSPAVEARLNSGTVKGSPGVRRKVLGELLREFPYAPGLIEPMLLADLEEDRPVGKGWLEGCKVPPAVQPLLDGLVMRYRLLQGDGAGAREALEKCHSPCRDEAWLNTAAEVMARTGETGRAMDLYWESLDLDGLQLPVRYRLAELEHPFRPDPSLLEGHTAIFLYSFNKRDVLRQTLRSLAQSQQGRARVVVLLNDCTDGSQDMVAALNLELFSGALEVISLPTNIGAPAARNWLLSTEAGRTSDHVAFLDDDVDIPGDWLASLLTVLRDNPGAGVAGAKILAPGRPRRLQYLYRNIAVARQDLVRISLDSPNFNFDGGVYDFVRPTANVMGCCHVFTRAALEAAPRFDIRFSPTQMDDIAHDLDLCVAGFKVMYCGLVACVHHQMSGLGRNTSQDLARQGNVLGNDVKFHYRFLDRIEGLRRLNNLAAIPELPQSAVRPTAA